MSVVKVAVIGAGISGIMMGCRLRQAGILDFLILEKAARVQLLAGGREQTWTADEQALAKREHVYSARGQANVWAYLTRRLGRGRRG